MASKKLPKGITQRQDGRFMGRFQYDGERHTLYDNDLEQLQVRMQDLQYELRHGLYAKEETITVNNWFNTWIEEYKKPCVKLSTLEVYLQTYRNHIKKPIGSKKLKDIRPEHIQKILNKMSEKYTYGTICSVQALVHGLFSQAYKNQLIRRNPAEFTTMPKKGSRQERRVLTVDEQNTILQHASGICKNMIEISLSTGMRSGELRGLEWDNIDFTNRTIHITGTLVKTQKKTFKGSTKTESSTRDIPMLDNVYAILRKVRRQQSENRLAMGNRWSTTEGLENLVFTKEDGAYISASEYHYMLSKVEDHIRKEQPDFKHIHPHAFRHTFATRCIEKNIPPQVVKSLLGHSTLAMTMDLYAHVLPDTKAEEMKKIAGLF